MEVAILVSGVIAALGAVGALVVPLLLGWPRVEMKFVGFRKGPGAVTFDVAVHNKGQRTIPGLELYASVLGQGVRESLLIVNRDFAGDEYKTFAFAWPSDRFEEAAGEDAFPVLKVPPIVVAMYGGKVRRLLSLPPGSIGRYTSAKSRRPKRQLDIATKGWIRRRLRALPRLPGRARAD